MSQSFRAPLRSRPRGEELNRFIEQFEREHFGFTPDRVLYGDSMGGHNAYRWALDAPGLFSKLALICPAFPKRYVTDAIVGPSAGPLEFLADTLIQDYYATSADPGFNPIHHGLNDQGRNMISKVHVIVSDIDYFGFYDGGLALYRQLSQDPYLEVSHEVQSIDHCYPEPTRLAEFLATP